MTCKVQYVSHIFAKYDNPNEFSWKRNAESQLSNMRFISYSELMTGHFKSQTEPLLYRLSNSMNLTFNENNG